MDFPHITARLAGCLALVQVALTVLVIVRRAQTHIGFLDGGDTALMRRIRAHGNFTENVPLALMLVGLYEVGGGASHWVWLAAGSVLLGRLLHATSLLTNNAAWSRRGGMTLTLLVLSGLGVASLI